LELARLEDDRLTGARHLARQQIDAEIGELQRRVEAVVLRTPRERFELNAIESIAVMVSRDLGVAILPRSTNGAIERLGLLA
ncbi:hypothetical protein SB751_34305, partial [Cupriavidus sp. SIMBA_020]